MTPLLSVVIAQAVLQPVHSADRAIYVVYAGEKEAKQCAKKLSPYAKPEEAEKTGGFQIQPDRQAFFDRAKKEGYETVVLPAVFEGRPVIAAFDPVSTGLEELRAMKETLTVASGKTASKGSKYIDVGRLSPGAQVALARAVTSLTAGAAEDSRKVAACADPVLVLSLEVAGVQHDISVRLSKGQNVITPFDTFGTWGQIQENPAAQNLQSRSYMSEPTVVTVVSYLDRGLTAAEYQQVSWPVVDHVHGQAKSLRDEIKKQKDLLLADDRSKLSKYSLSDSNASIGSCSLPKAIKEEAARDFSLVLRHAGKPDPSLLAQNAKITAARIDLRISVLLLGPGTTENGITHRPTVGVALPTPGG